jgi:hypothetical protein
MGTGVSLARDPTRGLRVENTKTLAGFPVAWALRRQSVGGVPRTAAPGTQEVNPWIALVSG